MQPTPADEPRPRVAPALTFRENEVLELTSFGLTNDQIAARLDVGVHAIKFHLASIYRKLGVANRTEAASVYLRAAGYGFAEPGGRGTEH